VIELHGELGLEAHATLAEGPVWDPLARTPWKGQGNVVLDAIRRPQVRANVK
jgi:hypothetical protein